VPELEPNVWGWIIATLAFLHVGAWVLAGVAAALIVLALVAGWGRRGR
jgi:hypothetical protein